MFVFDFFYVETFMYVDNLRINCLGLLLFECDFDLKIFRIYF